VSFRKLIEITLDEDGTETTETYDLRSCFDGASRCPANASGIVAQVGVFETVGRNEGVDIKAVRLGATD